MVFLADTDLWRKIEEFDGYFVSKNGEVFSTKTNQYLTIFKGSCGYLNVYLYNGHNKKFTRKVHRLVGLAFISNRLNKPQINHIDGNKHNNKVENLEWVNNSENAKHAIRTGLRRKPKGENNPVCKISDNQLLEIRKLLTTDIKQVMIAKMYNISPQVISRIKLGERKLTNE